MPLLALGIMMILIVSQPYPSIAGREGGYKQYPAVSTTDSMVSGGNTSNAGLSGNTEDDKREGDNVGGDKSTVGGDGHIGGDSSTAAGINGNIGDDKREGDHIGGHNSTIGGDGHIGDAIGGDGHIGGDKSTVGGGGRIGGRQGKAFGGVAVHVAGISLGGNAAGTGVVVPQVGTGSLGPHVLGTGVH